jgi:hypothetical protein
MGIRAVLKPVFRIHEVLNNQFFSMEYSSETSIFFSAARLSTLFQVFDAPNSRQPWASSRQGMGRFALK